MPVGEMLRRMDSAEITEWMAYFKLETLPKKKASDVIKAQFAHRVKRKEK
jgi:hypothetical protein